MRNWGKSLSEALLSTTVSANDMRKSVPWGRDWGQSKAAARSCAAFRKPSLCERAAAAAVTVNIRYGKASAAPWMTGMGAKPKVGFSAVSRYPFRAGG